MSLVTRGLGARTAGLAAGGMGRKSYIQILSDLWVMTTLGWEQVISIYAWNGSWVEALELYFKDAIWKKVK